MYAIRLHAMPPNPQDYRAPVKTIADWYEEAEMNAQELEADQTGDGSLKNPVPQGWIGVNGKLLPCPSTVEEAVRVILASTGEDVEREGLKETPGRVARAIYEMTRGIEEDPAKILSKVFNESYDEIVISKYIPFTSLCEHHLLPFSGTADIGYLPSGSVVGLSKLARLVDCFAKRLQVQEKLTKQIAQAIEQNLQPKGVAVVLRAEHACMACRGVKKSGSTMITSVMLGVFRDKPEARQEFLTLCQG